MKGIYSTVVSLVLAVFCLASCDKVQQQELPDVLILSPNAKSVISAGADIQVKISANYPVTAECAESWVHLSMGEGVCLVSVDEYKGDVIRIAEVVFSTSKGAREVFSLTQFSAEQEDIISIDPKTARISEKGGQVDVSVAAYYDVNCFCEESWVSVVKNGRDKFTVSVEPNAGGVVRTGDAVFVTVLGASDTLRISQDAADLISVDITKINVSADAESFEVKVSSVYDFTASSSESWVHVAETEAGRFTISTDDNRTSRDPRSATVTFTSSRGATATLTVIQGGFVDEVSLSVTSMQATEYGARIEVTVTSNYSVTASSDSEWIAVSGSAFNYTVDVKRNETSQAREGYVKFTSIHGASASLKVSQKAGVAPGDGNVLPFIDIVDIDYD